MAVDIQNIPPKRTSINDNEYAIIIETVVEPVTGSTEPAIKDPKNIQTVPISQNIKVLISAMNMSFFRMYINLMVYFALKTISSLGFRGGLQTRIVPTYAKSLFLFIS